MRATIAATEQWRTSLTTVVGVLVDVTEGGHPLVDYPGNQGGPVEARSVLAMEAAESRCRGERVLLVFENGDASSPLILGVVHDSLYAGPVTQGNSGGMTKAQEVLVDGNRLVFEAKEEVVIRCGKASVTLRRDGKIVLKGTNLVSRSSGKNRIMGASVGIN